MNLRKNLNPPTSYTSNQRIHLAKTYTTQIPKDSTILDINLA
jgi:hypothetical protein